MNILYRIGKILLRMNGVDVDELKRQVKALIKSCDELDAENIEYIDRHIVDQETIGKLKLTISDLGEEINHLKEVHTPLEPCGTVDLHLASSLLLDELEKLGDSEAGLYLPDQNIKKYNKEDVKNHQGLEEISQIVYEKEKHDCDDFAAKAFGLFLGLVWTTLHALNWFIDEDDTFWWVEPQTHKMSRELEGWQGSDIQFFMGR